MGNNDPSRGIERRFAIDGTPRYRASAYIRGRQHRSSWTLLLEEAQQERTRLLALRAEKGHKRYRRRPRRPEVIYFVQAGDRGPIKVGRSAETLLEQRISNLQIGNHEDLRLIATVPGDPTLEHELHVTLNDSRVRGEWFGSAAVLVEVEKRSQTRGQEGRSGR